MATMSLFQVKSSEIHVANNGPTNLETRLLVIIHRVHFSGMDDMDEVITNIQTNILYNYASRRLKININH